MAGAGACSNRKPASFAELSGSATPQSTRREVLLRRKVHVLATPNSMPSHPRRPLAPCQLAFDRRAALVG
jgi:hypothetical protein